MIAAKPTSLSHVEAASVPVIAVTAWQALFDQAQLKPGETVLIHGAAGNVGAFAVQFARRASVRVVATVFGDDAGIVKDLGTDIVIDSQKQRFEEEVPEVDAVIDLVGGETQTRSFQVVRRGGKLVSTVSQPDQQLAAESRVTASFFLVNVTTEYLAEIGRLIDSGEIRTHVGVVLPLSDAREAHLMLERVRPQPKGKIVLNAE
jgi:NADPH:quinone reductase-like Zn-dependent oxidoreductase